MLPSAVYRSSFPTGKRLNFKPTTQRCVVLRHNTVLGLYIVTQRYTFNIFEHLISTKMCKEHCFCLSFHPSNTNVQNNPELDSYHNFIMHRFITRLNRYQISPQSSSASFTDSSGNTSRIVTK